MSPTRGNEDVDPRLVAGARAGDRDGLAALVEAAYPWVRRWARGWAADRADADDLTQDVLIRMLRNVDGYRGEARFTSWLYALTRSVAFETRRGRDREERRRERWAVAEHGARPATLEDPLAAVTHEREGATLEGLFRRLPDRQREVFDLVELQGMSAVEAAELLGVEPVTVRAHLHRARQTLRRRILSAHPHLVPDMR